MKQRIQRIGVIILMLAVLAYTIYNYVGGKTDQTTFMLLLVFMGWMLLSQIYGLIRDWKDG